MVPATRNIVVHYAVVDRAALSGMVHRSSVVAFAGQAFRRQNQR